ncbi:cell division protein DivIVA [Bifidobacterium sp. DSM 109958]|uniref:Cell division protein DivIVA n=1 Tax=Bifidobacterium moraviense TaxID=2675323 RepID=A0A7Y0F166_9BIFI|nr:DivIVA domain-containing protein [Bifidobacterium sp. DSM 109958]NMN00133.1 cell division protein DivIVA [Bifidobacterium sp. DSM 109958]
MSQQPEGSGRGPVISRAGKRKWGYDVGQVDEFLAHAHELYDSEEPKLTQHDIQNASFDLVKNGYVIAQVDAALARLERAVVDQHTSWELAHGGRVPFKARSESMLAELKPHYEREHGERFRAGTGKQPSYDRKQVDRLIDQVIAKASAAVGAAGADADADDRKTSDLTAARVAGAVFTQRKGKRGYDERCVDYYLDAAVQLLSRLESFARVNEYDHADDRAAAPAHDAAVRADGRDAVSAVPPAPAPAAAAASSLFAAAAASAPVPAPPAPAAPTRQDRLAAEERQESFASLNAAEQSIFRPRTDSATVPAPAAQTPAPAPAPQQAPKPSVAPAPAFNAAETPGETASSSLAALAHSVDHADVAPAPASHDPEPQAAPKPAQDMAATQSFTPWFAQDTAQNIAPVPAPQPQPAPDRAAAPAAPQQTSPAPASEPQPAPQPAAEPEQDDADRYLSNLLANTSFPKVDLDIPDLAFPSLSGGLDAPKDASKPGTDHAGHDHE